MPTLRATTSFALPGRRVIREGDLVDASDPAVRGREYLFVSSDEATAEPPIERATARPGEKRTTRRQDTEHVCDVCGDTAKTAAGLAAHKRSHDED